MRYQKMLKNAAFNEMKKNIFKNNIFSNFN